MAAVMGWLLTSVLSKGKILQVENKYFCCNGLENMAVSGPAQGKHLHHGDVCLLTREGNKEKEGDGVAGDNRNSGPRTGNFGVYLMFSLFLLP